MKIRKADVNSDLNKMGVYFSSYNHKFRGTDLLVLVQSFNSGRAGIS